MMSEEKASKEEAEYEAPGAEPTALSTSQMEKPPSNKGTRYFIIGGALGLVISCFMAFDFFLVVEDNPRTLLSYDLPRALAPILVVEAILVCLALVFRRGWWKVPAGWSSLEKLPPTSRKNKGKCIL
jgi:hypothetical protein